MYLTKTCCQTFWRLHTTALHRLIAGITFGLRLRSATPVTQASASPGCSEFKMQCAALDVLAFLSGDSSLVQNISKQLLALAIKFLSPRVADKLKGDCMGVGGADGGG